MERGVSRAPRQTLRAAFSRAPKHLQPEWGSGVSRVTRRETHGTEDDPEPGLPAARIRVRQDPAGAGRGGGRAGPPGGRGAPAGQRPGAVLRLRPAGSGLRPPAAAPLPVRAGAGPANVLRVRDAARALPALRQGEGGARAVGAGQAAGDRGPGLVPRQLGQAAVVEGDRDGLRGELGPGLPRGRDGGGVGPGTRVAGRGYDDRRGRDRVAERASLPDLGVPVGRGLPTAAVGGAGAQDHDLGELLHMVRKGALGAAAGGLLGHVEGLPAGGQGAGEPGAARAGPLPHCAEAGQGDRQGAGGRGEAAEGARQGAGVEEFALAAAEAAGAADREAGAEAGGAAQAEPAHGAGLPAEGRLPAAVGLPLADAGQQVPQALVPARDALADPADAEGGEDAQTSRHRPTCI